ncbi:MAG: hypothetical protein B6D44_06240 [Ignavibacteriales bacterium UTCHB2]|jgi:hypothetical protein|nr:MAG: hypothetical protein BWY38_00968 [Ignavibacteria bacterium ADurb.Bin266]OQY73737.1 MAG: hypothetical protein B6D44_06240 [Ignavibacteriales bacterium UTCHB2]HQJ46085.1 hypothetical protein [Ignavibacteriaceae bacterium]
MKNIKWFFLILVFVLFSGLSYKTYSQSIYFCEDVDDDGDPINESSVFTIPSDGGYLYVLIQLPNSIDCDGVYMEVYRNGNYETTITIDTEPDWDYFWKQVTFYKTGKYVIDVYDCYDDFITSGSLKINME